MGLQLCDYIWIDGATPVAQVRSKGRVLFSKGEELTLDEVPMWNFDGSSCYQSEGWASDLLLQPVCLVKDPFKEEGAYLVLCEVLNPDGTPHKTNMRHKLRQVLERVDPTLDPWMGFEQEYTLFQEGRPLGWPESGEPQPQGPYYCAVGTGLAFGRDLVDAHGAACIVAGLAYYGYNAEVMPSQWEFQIGYRGCPGEDVGALRMADHLWIARWLLHRISEDFGVVVSFDNKPLKGDWNGAGMHTNYSTRETRQKGSGMEAIQTYIGRLERRHKDHIKVYGDRLEERLTGLHETCSIHEFRWGASDRGSSIRIPRQVALEGCGYLEDRRPGANADPYAVAAALIATTTEDVRA